MDFWANKRILVTGGAGFVGSRLVNFLSDEKNVPSSAISIPRSKNTDLRSLDNCLAAVEGKELVIHLAASVGGIGFNMDNPATLFYDNAIMGIQLMEAARQKRVGKFVAIGTICAYPKFTPVPFKEKDLWDGYPEETNAPYGLAKKMLLVQSQAYRKQYGFNSIYLLPVNLYGPGDNFDPRSSHVIPAMIKKFIDARDAGNGTVTLWGTGKASREFLYVDDAARGIILATERYDEPAPVNLGAGFEIRIDALAEKIKKLTKFKGEILWDSSKPDGQPRRMLDTSLAEEKFGFKAKMDLDTGLQRTIEWYESNRRI